MVQDTTPRSRIVAAARLHGERAFVIQCVAVLEGTRIEVSLLEVLGGNSVPSVLAGREGGIEGHWPRVWALRAFLYVWDPIAEPAVLSAGDDPNWRVREMAAKALGANDVTSSESERLLERLTADPSLRVRKAADAALR